MSDYILYNFEYIKEHQQEIIKELKTSHDIIRELGVSDSTFGYTKYNIFGVSSPSIHMYKIFETLRGIIRSQLPDGRLWIQSWLNYQDWDGVLQWHNHSSAYHGYISIEPQDTETEFEKWTIDNQAGNIYFGPGHHRHRVKNLREYKGKRITIGFDVMTDYNYQELDYYITENYGCIPLL